MSVAQMPRLAERLERRDASRLAWAFALSLFLHLLVFGTYRTGKELGWWENFRWPAWLQSVKLLTEVLKKKEAEPPPPPQEPPLMFVDVNPTTATPEPPKDTAYYSDKNSKAANPDADKETNTPKITGDQKEIVRTEDVPRTPAIPLQPNPPPTTPAKEEQPEEKPKPALTTPAPAELAKAEPTPTPAEVAKAEPPPSPGDLAMAKPAPIPPPNPSPIVPSATRQTPAPEPAPTPPKDEGEAPRQRPRTVKEALARNPDTRLTGKKMDQEGGVKRRAPESSLDVRSSPFGAYDAMIIKAIENRWYALLDERRFVGDRTGKVTVRFHLNSDGSISELAFVQNTVDLALGLLCQSAIKDPSPFAPWPGDMRRLIGSDHREVTFTFYYY